MAEKFCPVCKYKNDINASICVYCGSPLERSHENPSTTRNVEAETHVYPPATQETVTRTYEPPPQGIALYTTESEVPITIQQDNQFTLGRKMTGEMDESFVDLRPFGAYENGVSRRHAIIRKATGGYEIIDLGSTNGTWLEKQRIVPNRPYPLNNGSKIFLGRLQLIVIYQKGEEKP
jgi:pSer/pThr/pTyr-binding forkhead associated (FHA) protein